MRVNPDQSSTVEVLALDVEVEAGGRTWPCVEERALLDGVEMAIFKTSLVPGWTVKEIDVATKTVRRELVAYDIPGFGAGGDAGL